MKTRPLYKDMGVVVDGSDQPDLMALDAEGVKDLFRTYGLVLFDGFQTDTKVFQRFTDQFGQYMSNKGGGSVRDVINKDGDGTILSVSYNYNVPKQRTFGLPLHSDRSYVRSCPPLMWFYCVIPAAGDGHTTACDGVRFYEHLSPSTKTLFQQNRIKYIRHYSDNEWKLWCQTDNLGDVQAYCRDNGLSLTIDPDDQSVTTEYATSAIMKTRWGGKDAFVNSILIVLWQEDDLKRTSSLVRLENGSKIPPDVVAELKELATKLTEPIPWTPHSLAMLDNNRMMHGRQPFDDHNREIYVRMCPKIDW